jgi:hypothetical protein
MGKELPTNKPSTVGRRLSTLAWLRPLAALWLASCAVYGEETGRPPGPVPPSPEEGPPATAGELSPVVGNGAQNVLASGVYRGDLIVEGNGNVVSGMGTDQTVVRGRLIVRGDGNVVHSIRVLGPSLVEGEDNDVRGVVFEGGVDDSRNEVEAR